LDRRPDSRRTLTACYRGAEDGPEWPSQGESYDPYAGKINHPLE